MKTQRDYLVFSAICVACLLLTGCTSSFKLPEVSGKVVDYKRTDPFGGTTVVAKGVQVTEDKVKADEVTWTTIYPQVSITLRVEGYERKRDTAAK